MTISQRCGSRSSENAMTADRLQILKDLLNEVRTHEMNLVESEFFGTADLLTDFRVKLVRQIHELESRLEEDKG